MNEIIGVISSGDQLAGEIDNTAVDIQVIIAAAGPKGDMPDHQIVGNQVRFQKPDGTWGDWITLSTGGGTVEIASENTLGVIKVGQNLKIDANGVLSVDTANTVEQDNTKPVTSAAVHTQLGNIEALLEAL